MVHFSSQPAFSYTLPGLLQLKTPLQGGTPESQTQPGSLAHTLLLALQQSPQLYCNNCVQFTVFSLSPLCWNVNCLRTGAILP